ncbi:MAG TPA: hypothetical protein VIT44_02290 [Cyclobacteriaceae bacterium]
MISSFVENTLSAIISETEISCWRIEMLHSRGYTDHLSLIGNKIISRRTGEIFFPIELTVDDIYCCDETGCPGYYIYTLSHSVDGGMKGILTILLPRAHEEAKSKN